MMGVRDESTYLSLANRLSRMDRQIKDKERNKIKEMSGGLPLGAIVNDLMDAHNPDRVEERAKRLFPDTKVIQEEQFKKAQDELLREASKVFTGELNEYLDNVRKALEQIIDTVNIDAVTFSGWDKQAKSKAESVVSDFKQFIQDHKDEIAALTIFYNQPYRRRDITYKMIKEVFDILKDKKPYLAPLRVWEAYSHIEGVTTSNPKSELTALVGLIRKIVGIDKELTDHDVIVRRNFRDWVVRSQAGHKHFSQTQLEWLHMIRDHVAASFHIERDDFSLSPFGEKGGLGKFYELFGSDTDKLIDELNEALVA
jgi:type I restriction enzyme R subunit